MDSNIRQTLDVNKYKNILNIWECFVCKKIPERPLKIVMCQHAFCRNCVLNVRNCPKCGEQFTRNDLRPCSLMRDYVSLFEDMSKLIPLLSAKNIPEKKESEEDKAEQSKSEIVKSNAYEVNNDDNNQLLPTLIKQTVPDVILSETDAYMKRKASIESWLKPSKTIRIKKETDLPVTEIISPTNLVSTHSVTRRSSTSMVSKCSENEAKPLSTPKSGRKEKKTPQRKRLEHKIKILELEKRNLKGETRLHSACVKGNLELVNSLLKEGANPNVKDYAGWTPLVEAVGQSNLPLVSILLEHGAWVNTPCLLNTTPLLEAVCKKNQNIIQILLKYGADMNLRSNIGHTPLSIAQDDQVIHNILLTCQPDCSVLEKIEPPFCPQNIPVICCDIIEKNQKHQIFKLCQELNFEVKCEFWEMATHVVTNTDEELNCECTFNVMQGILAGASIINFKWLLECHKANSTIPIDGYEVKGTKNYPNTGAMKIARLNTYKMNPKLFDGCYFSIAGKWVDRELEISFRDFVTLIQCSGASYLLRDPDPEAIPDIEKKVMFHSNTSSSMSLVSHIILYPPNIDCNKEPRMKYNMNHVKSLPTTWFLKCIQTFTICDP